MKLLKSKKGNLSFQLNEALKPLDEEKFPEQVSKKEETFFRYWVRSRFIVYRIQSNKPIFHMGYVVFTEDRKGVNKLEIRNKSFESMYKQMEEFANQAEFNRGLNIIAV